MVAKARALALGALALVACGDSTPKPLPPSVIVISLDTLRADHTSFMGYERETTPYLDSLTEESIVFERAYAPSHWTLVSHASLLSGLYPSQHGVGDADKALHPDLPLLAESLRAKGYQTFGHYFPGWIHPRHGFASGFDVFEPHLNAEEAEANVAVSMAKRSEKRPFFLFLHLFDIHCGHLERGDRPIYEPPPPFDDMFLSDATERLRGIDCKSCWEEPGLLDEGQIEAVRALYDGGIRYVDQKLETWIEGWRSEGLLDNTLIIITSDHGEALGQRDGRIDGHGGFFEEGIHVPMLVRLPGGKRGGERVSSPVSLVDVMPTIRDVCGFGVEPSQDGLPGYSLISGRPEGSILLGSQNGIDVWIRWPYKLALYDDGTRAMFTNLVEDPLELSPQGLEGDELARVLADLEADLEAEYRDRPLQYIEPAPALEMSAEDDATLRALGYAGDF